jgi:pre-60S factor REI1
LGSAIPKTPLPVPQDSLATAAETQSGEQQHDEDVKSEADAAAEQSQSSESELNARMESAAKLSANNDCLFCRRSFATQDLKVQHMAKTHSFFIPDLEYLKDLVGSPSLCSPGASSSPLIH